MRTLLISIKDNKQAEVLVREIAERQGLLDDDAEPYLTDNELMLGIVGLFDLNAMIARPTLGCKCSGKPAGRKVGYTQTERFKWWVHGAVGCKRPTTYIVRNFIRIILSGNADLLSEIIPG